jgi:hypothetical protein
MGVIVVSLYLLFVVNRVLGEKPSAVTCGHMLPNAWWSQQKLEQGHNPSSQTRCYNEWFSM